MTDLIHAKRAELLQRRAVIDAQLALLDELAGGTPAAAAAPPTAPPAPLPPPPRSADADAEAAPVRRSPAAAAARRLLVARLIADKGPQRCDEVVRELGVGHRHAWYTLSSSGWFEKAGDGSDRYALTDAGRAGLAASARGPGE